MSDPTAQATISATSVNSTGGALADSVHRLARGAHSEINSAAEAAGPALERVATGAHHAIDSADRVATNAAQGLEAIGVKGEQAAASGVGYLREHPVLSLGLAVAVGYMLSRLLASR
jgi:ElaB/YqjD/DUF883 family membrane-anchored ribosome-binding protein